jgi:hypothetical protein
MRRRTSLCYPDSKLLMMLYILPTLFPRLFAVGLHIECVCDRVSESKRWQIAFFRWLTAEGRWSWGQ